MASPGGTAEFSHTLGNAGTADTARTESASPDDMSFAAVSFPADVYPHPWRSSTICPTRHPERGVIILLVAVVLLFVVGAMAALSIDVVTFYTARSEAQLTADAAALAGARVLANSGLTSTFTSASPVSTAAAEALATTVAYQIAASSNVAGRPLVPGTEVIVTFNDANLTNPRVNVQTKRTDIPTFFARIWGRTAVTVQASATAEAYNPSGASALGGTVAPVAPTCVKPWVLPNMSPNGGPIISRLNGAILDTNLVGEDLTTIAQLQARCAPGACGGSWWATATPTAWQYYPGDPTSFPGPTSGLPACAAGFNATQNSIAGCVQTPIACGNGSSGLSLVNLEKVHGFLRAETADAVNCLIHASANAGDSIAPASGPLGGPGLPFKFLAGADNPLLLAGAISAGTDVLVSDSIVTVPIYDDGSLSSVPVPPVQIVGFVQLFLSPNGAAIPTGSSPNVGTMNAMVLNIAGCGTGATGQPILGNGASPVPVRLITGP